MTTHQLETLPNGRFRCVICTLHWNRVPTTDCPGVPVYRWGEWPPHLLTKKQMDDSGFQTGQKLPPPAGVVFRAKSPGNKMWLYDRNQGVPKRQVSPEQKAQLQERAQQIQTGWRCTRCGDRLRRYIKGGGLCDICRDHARAVDWARFRLASETPFLILDTETTGLTPGYNEIIQLSVIDSTGAVLLNTLIQAQNPERMFESDGQHQCAYDIHGIHPDALKDAPTFPQVYEQLQAIVADRKVVIYNAAYDIGMLDGDCRRHNLQPLETDEWECAMEWYSEWFGDWSYHWRDYRWQPLNGGHSALEDCQAVLNRIYEMAEGETIASPDAKSE